MVMPLQWFIVDILCITLSCNIPALKYRCYWLWSARHFSVERQLTPGSADNFKVFKVFLCVVSMCCPRQKYIFVHFSLKKLDISLDKLKPNKENYKPIYHSINSLPEVHDIQTIAGFKSRYWLHSITFSLTSNFPWHWNLNCRIWKELLL